MAWTRSDEKRLRLAKKNLKNAKFPEQKTMYQARVTQLEARKQAERPEPEKKETAGERFAADHRKYEEGEINFGQLAGRLLGEGGHAIGKVVGAPLEAAMKVINPLGQFTEPMLTSAIANTDTAQAVRSEMEANPELARDLSSVAGMVELAPYGRLATGGGSSLFNRAKDETQTDMPGFYSGNQVGAFLEKAFKGLPEALRVPFSPQARAQAREVGTGQTRVDEALDPPKQGTYQGNLNASHQMNAQANNTTERNTVISNLPTVVGSSKGQYRITERESIKEQLASHDPDVEVPPHIVEAHLNRSERALTPSGKKEAVAGRTTNVVPVSADDTIVNVRDPRAPQSAIGGEALGTTSTGSRALSRLGSEKGLQMFAESRGKSWDQLDAQDIAEYIRTAGVLEKQFWPEVSKGLKMSQSAFHTAYLAGLKRIADGKKPTDKQQDVIDRVNAYKDKVNVHINDRGEVEYRTYVSSTEQDLGNMGVVSTILPETRTAYSNAADDHDMFGATPPGGARYWNITPILSMKYGPDAPKPDTGRKTQEVADREKAAVKRVEEMTGIPRMPGETLIKYEQRVLRDYKAQPTTGDKASAATTGLLTGIALTEDEEN